MFSSPHGSSDKVLEGTGVLQTRFPRVRGFFRQDSRGYETKKNPCRAVPKHIIFLCVDSSPYTVTHLTRNRIGPDHALCNIIALMSQ